MSDADINMIYLGHIDKRLPHPAAVLLEDPLLEAFTPHQVEHTVLQSEIMIKDCHSQQCTVGMDLDISF